MHPIFFSAGPLTVYSYGAMLSLAFIAGIFATLRLCKDQGIEPEAVLDTVLWMMILAVIGARLSYVIFFWGEFSGDLTEIVMIQHGGLAFYGGLLGALGAIIWRVRKLGINTWKALDLAAPGTAIGYSIGRLGCFLNGCCYGIETSLPWAVAFPNVPGLRHPTQIYSSISGLLIFLALLLLWGRKRFDGQIFLFALIFYSVYRMLIEFLRYGVRYCGLTASQWFSIIVFIFACSALVWIMNKKTDLK